jgi:multidrug efflux pump subunit AcrA (membrane-fusion protein)
MSEDVENTEKKESSSFGRKARSFAASVVGVLASSTSFANVADAKNVEQDDNSYLYIVNDDNTVSKRVVKLGKSVDGIIQVVDNVMPGERVVVDGMLAISDGVKVYDISNPVKEEAKEDTQTTGGK